MILELFLAADPFTGTQNRCGLRSVNVFTIIIEKLDSVTS